MLINYGSYRFSQFKADLCHTKHKFNREVKS